MGRKRGEVGWESGILEGRREIGGSRSGLGSWRVEWDGVG